MNALNTLLIFVSFGFAAFAFGPWWLAGYLAVLAVWLYLGWREVR